MPRIAHILTPVDPTSTNQALLAQALFWAQQLNATVHALEVRVTDGDTLPETSLHAQPSSTVRDTVHAYAERIPIASLNDLAVRPMHMHAPTVVHGLLHYAAHHAIDLIMVTAGRDDWTSPVLSPRLLTNLAQQTPHPLFIVRADAATEPNASAPRVLAPIDFSRHAQRGLDCAMQIAALYGASLDVLHVLERPPYVALNAVDMLALSDATLPERRAERRIQALLDRTPESSATARIHVKHGDPAGTIASFADAHGSDLVILSAHDTTSPSRHTLGTVADKLVRRLDTSLLLIKASNRSPSGMLSDSTL